MIKIGNKQDCCGCGACVQRCPKHCILMKEDTEGFLYPEADQNICVDCGLCEKVCPLKNPADRIPVIHVYAAKNRNEQNRLASSSGGVFIALAEKTINAGGAVFGAVFDENWEVVHACAEDLKGVKRMMGSKYVQSNIGDAYFQAERILQSGRLVLFTGTPCQIAGLHRFLRRDYANLLAVDFLCHGVPSPLFFKENLAFLEQKYGDRIVDFKFRAKKESGWRSYVKYVFNRQKPKWAFLGKNYYTHAFHLGYFNRLSCYSCNFSRSERVGDITLSDFWGGEAHNRMLKKARKWGFNLVMCNTPQGQRLFDSVAGQIVSLKCPVEWAIRGDVRLRHTEPRPVMRDKAYKILKEKGYAYMSSAYGIKESMLQRMVPVWAKNLIREIQSRI